MIRVCHFYYEMNMTQQQIANKMSISRMTVSRILQKARDEGVVSIKISYEGAFVNIEDMVREKYGISDVVVCINEDESKIKEILASTAANYLEDYIKKGMTVAIGWGTTLSYIPEHLRINNQEDLLFVPIIGGHGESSLDLHATQIAANFAKKTGARSLPLLAPAMVKSTKEKETILSNKFIASTLEKAASADLALISLGAPLANNSTIGKSGYFSDDEINGFEVENAECDIVSILYIDKNGKECNKDISTRSIGLTKEQLRSISTKICVVGGKDKHFAVKLALERGYIDNLVTDIETANYLLNV